MGPWDWIYVSPDLDLWTPDLGLRTPTFVFMDPQVWGWVCGGNSFIPSLFLQVWVCSAVAELVLHSQCHQEKPRWVCCALCVVEFRVLPRNNPIKTPAVPWGALW